MLNKFDYPRPEYPRPERQRGLIEGVDWINLNGPWQFRFDGADSGVEGQWFAKGQPPWREQIIVPFCWESLAAWGEGDSAGNDHYYAMRIFKNPLEVTRLNHHIAPRYEIGWYRRTLILPGHGLWAGQRIILTIGAADFHTTLWCNGIQVGDHEGGYEPIEFDLTDALDSLSDGTRTGEIVIRVQDPMDNSQQPVGKQWKWYSTTSGIWQTVFVEPRSIHHIHHFRITPDIDQEIAHFDLWMQGASERESEVVLEITAPSGRKQTATLPVTQGRATLGVKVSPLQLWDPCEPLLYRVVLRLRCGQEDLDIIHSYFGMRKIDTAARADVNAPGSLRLNNKPLYLRGALYQSYFPDGIYTAGDCETIRDDIAYAKKVGFDFLRVHIKMDDPLVYYYADTLGMLLMADFPNFGEEGDSPIARQRFEKLIRAGIDRDFNHPSIIAWCLFNETWGFGGQTELMKHFPSSKAAAALIAAAPDAAALPTILQASKLSNLSAHEWVHCIWALAKTLDGTRMIEDMSVVHWDHLEYFQHTETDINSWHFYDSDYYNAREHILKVVANCYSGSSFNFVDGFKQSNQPLINSEYGGVGALDGDRDISWSFKFLTNELRRHPALSAYVFTQLHDVEWECNGFLNYDRSPKQFGFDPTMINHGDVIPVDSPPIWRVRPGEKIKVPVFSSHYSRKLKEKVFLEWRLSGIDTTGCIYQDLDRGIVGIDFPHRDVVLAKEVEVTAPMQTMLCKLLFTAHSRGEQIAYNYVECLVASDYPPEQETLPRGRILRMRPQNWSHAEWSGGYQNREEAQRDDRCCGSGSGFFEWVIPMNTDELKQTRRLRLLCEASSHRSDNPQTGPDAYPSTLEIWLNDVPVHRAHVPDHPHDSRGSLSYLRGAIGSYGYLSYCVVEGPLLEEVVRHSENGNLRFRCVTPQAASAMGGLTIYGSECGRFPISPTVVMEW